MSGAFSCAQTGAERFSAAARRGSKLRRGSCARIGPNALFGRNDIDATTSRKPRGEAKRIDQMRIEIADGRTLGLVAMVGAAIGKEDWTEKKDYKTDGVKLSADGRVMFGTRKALLWMDENGETVQDVSVSVLEPVEAKAASRVVLAGKTTVSHWVKDRGRLAVSIVAERLEPVKSGE